MGDEQEMTAVITIGRNIGAGPEQLSEDQWRAYIKGLEVIAFDLKATTYFFGAGYGIWKDLAEDAFTRVIGIQYHQAGTLGAKLGELVKEYGQESIAVTLGRVVFVGR